MVMAVVVLLLAVVGVVIIAVRLLRRVRSTKTVTSEPDPLLPLPNIEDLSVGADAIRVTFKVPMAGDDPILTDLLCYYGLQAVRDARRSLPLEGLDRMEVFVSHQGRTRRVGRVDFEERGRLPEGLPVPEIVKLAEAMDDPLDSEFAASKGSKAQPRPAEGEALSSLGAFLRIPAGVEAALRMQGIDPATMTAGELVRGILLLRGYAVTAGPDEATHHATKGRSTVMVREVRHARGEYPELSEQEIHRFIMDLARSPMKRGMLVTEKYGPFAVYSLERRDPRIRFVTRERLQKAIDALALG